MGEDDVESFPNGVPGRFRVCTDVRCRRRRCAVAELFNISAGIGLGLRQRWLGASRSSPGRRRAALHSHSTAAGTRSESTRAGTERQSGANQDVHREPLA